MTKAPAKEKMRTIAFQERARFRDTLSTLTAEQWATPSLCQGWTVRDVAAHVVHNACVTTLGFLGGMARTKFDHDRYNVRTAARWATVPTGRLVGALDNDHLMLIFRRNPFLPMVDTIVHHQDIRRPLGLGKDIPAPHLLAALGAVTTEKMFSHDAKRAAGLRLIATDLDWQHGGGSIEVRGPGEALLMAIMGRRVDLAELAGSDQVPSTTGFGAALG